MRTPVPCFSADVATLDGHADIAVSGDVLRADVPLLDAVLDAVRHDDRVRTITVDLEAVTALDEDVLVGLLRARRIAGRHGKVLALDGAADL